MGHYLQYDYVHRDLDRSVSAIGGHYRFCKEGRLSFRGRQVLYLCGYALFDTTCCGSGGCGYALVQGVVINWKYKKDPDGFSISRMEEIGEPDSRKEIQRLIQAKEKVQQVRFRAWL
ncbi:hypothetical protein DSCA_37420 [Desulfosarcina alkanivorans]|jgi:hypothetical protein|uniref:Uncharacterized protein n=1 Tax=Desulfosarcina alkanivorans TaxID=571177 RepID=A0A5K7YJF2_9BACT|nr:hypothetical protein [Desulfosarcina alkanivorans]BBO69812.1 hypothetical protein DSCA_37420 [Desulfosarcina alkanivorans]